MNTSVRNIFLERSYNSSSSPIEPNVKSHEISDHTKGAIQLVRSFSSLQPNWDFYGAFKPSEIAIQKAISVILDLAQFGIDVFFTAPAPNGNILVEIKDELSSIEIELSANESDSITAVVDGEVMQEAELNETTFISYVKWLICPNGNCPPSLG